MANGTKKKKKILCVVGVVLIACVIACGVYVNDYYHADTERMVAFSAENAVEVAAVDGGLISFIPEEPTAGLIFYPGGKVEYTAYAPLMQELASDGILCVLVKMPFNLAVLDSGAAEGIPQQYPQIDTWYIGGHSLGGSMAASYVSGCAADYAGLILLASYSTADLSGTGLAVLSVYGSEDGVMNRESYAENRGNLPADFTEVVLDGGCHAYFGMYGSQEGDGTPAITNEEQIHLTADAVSAFVQNRETATSRFADNPAA